MCNDFREIGKNDLPIASTMRSVPVSPLRWKVEQVDRYGRHAVMIYNAVPTEQRSYDLSISILVPNMLRKLSNSHHLPLNIDHPILFVISWLCTSNRVPALPIRGGPSPMRRRAGHGLGLGMRVMRCSALPVRQVPRRQLIRIIQDIQVEVIKDSIVPLLFLLKGICFVLSSLLIRRVNVPTPLTLLLLLTSGNQRRDSYRAGPSFNATRMAEVGPDHIGVELYNLLLMLIIAISDVRMSVPA